MRSELRDQKTMPITAMRFGMATRRPTWKTEKPRPLTISGAQKPMV